MSFSINLHTLLFSKQYISKKQQSLQFSSNAVHECKNKYRGKICKSCTERTSVPAFRREGILTIEAGVCITFFMLAALSLMSLFQVTADFSQKQMSFVETARKQSIYTKTADEVHIDFSYRFKPSLLVLANVKIPMHHEVYIKSWTGYKPVQNEDENMQGKRIYYVTDFESVYHTTRDCTHLSLSVRMVSTKGSISGAYTPCEKCGKQTNISGNYYVTEEGRRYHTSLSCPGLKRTIYEVTDIYGLSPCSRCG